MEFLSPRSMFIALRIFVAFGVVVSTSVMSADVKVGAKLAGVPCPANQIGNQVQGGQTIPVYHVLVPNRNCNVTFPGRSYFSITATASQNYFCGREEGSFGDALPMAEAGLRRLIDKISQNSVLYGADRIALQLANQMRVNNNTGSVDALNQLIILGDATTQGLRAYYQTFPGGGQLASLSAGQSYTQQLWCLDANRVSAINRQIFEVLVWADGVYRSRGSSLAQEVGQ